MSESQTIEQPKGGGGRPRKEKLGEFVVKQPRGRSRVEKQATAHIPKKIGRPKTIPTDEPYL